MRLALAFALLAASPVVADELGDEAVLAFMGGQGCTFGPDSIAAAQDAGFQAAHLDAVRTGALADGTATQQGEWVVLNASVCTIRLPDITSPVSLDTPEIVAAFPYMREEYEVGGETIVNEGCFATDLQEAINGLVGGSEDEGFDAFLRVVAAGHIVGDLRFFSDDVLVSPVGVQRVSGDCARAPGVDLMARSHGVLLTGFGDYVRRLGEGTSCGDGAAFTSPLIIANELQGAQTSVADHTDAQTEPQTDPEVNAWLWFEWDIIAMAAGWHAGQSATDRGEPRPPLCHFPG